MKDQINNICTVEIAVANQVNVFIEGSTGFVHTDAVFVPIDIIPGARLTIQKTKGKAGRAYESSLDLSIRSEIDYQQGYIIRLGFDDGNPPLIIGDKDLPVFFEQSNSLTRKTIAISHASWHYPWRQFLND